MEGRRPWNTGVEWSETVKEKLRASWRADAPRREKFIAQRGGNGKISPAEALVRKILSENFLWNHAVATGESRSSGYPTCYKLDFANPRRMLAIEVDGFSHNSAARKCQDQKKEDWLQVRGWSVLRVSNQQVLAMCGISKLTELPTTLPTERSFITALRSKMRPPDASRH
jgi:hypothetical protein